jgi:hypothetical protein
LGCISRSSLFALGQSEENDGRSDPHQIANTAGPFRRDSRKELYGTDGSEFGRRTIPLRGRASARASICDQPDWQKGRRPGYEAGESVNQRNPITCAGFFD